MVTVLVVMGVSGSGKTTVARIVANRLGWQFAEGDEFHPQANIDKMASGHPLDDTDRWPWLDAIDAWITERVDSEQSAVVTCSALKREYRDVLRAPAVVFVYLSGSRDVLASRIQHRHGHFMPAALLDSQLADLEVPGPDEQAMTIDVAPSPPEIADTIVARLGE